MSSITIQSRFPEILPIIVSRQCLINYCISLCMPLLQDLKSEPDLLVEIIKRNSGNQTHSVETEHHGGPFGTGSEWSGTRR
jgi:hypothetical protein